MVHLGCPLEWNKTQQPVYRAENKQQEEEKYRMPEKPEYAE